jgi:hypothetical protein
MTRIEYSKSLHFLGFPRPLISLIDALESRISKMQRILKLKSPSHRDSATMGLASDTDAGTSKVASEVTSAEVNLRKFSAQHEWDPNIPGMCCATQIL